MPFISYIRELTKISLKNSKNGVKASIVNYSKTIKMFKKSPEAKKFSDNAYGFAVFPAIGKEGLL